MVGRGIRNLISDGLYSKMPGSDYIYHAQCSYSLDQGSNQQRSTNSLSYYGGKVLCFIRQRLGWNLTQSSHMFYSYAIDMINKIVPSILIIQ